MTAALRNRSTVLVLAAVAAAWAAVAGADLVGLTPALHHHALLQGGRPLWAAVGIFAPAWLVMVVAMMLPSSLPMLAAHDRVTAREPRPLASRVSFLAAYLLAWTAFGVAGLLGDSRLHALVHATPWLLAHQSVIGGATLAGAGAFQLTPLKRRCLTVCRSPLGFLLQRYRPGPHNAFRLGLDHALFCIGCCWALMLVMFAAGVAMLAWMLALTAVMVVERTTPGGDRMSLPIGLTLIGGAVATVFLGGVL